MTPTVLSLCGQTLDLYPQKAMYWRERRTLLVTDTHFGKAAFFRAHGVPVPHGTTDTDLQRLSFLLEHTHAERLIILGDFLHAKKGRAKQTLQAIRQWRLRHAQLPIVLIRGNHDSHAGDPPRSWNIDCRRGGLQDPPFEFRHEPPPDTEKLSAYVLAGHIHPAVTLMDTDGSQLRLPCFSFGERSALLPAFGSFTGTWTLTPRRTDRIFVMNSNAVMEVS